MIRSFFYGELEPVAYLIYTLAVFLQYHTYKSYRYKVLSVFYAGCAVLLYIGIAFFDNNNWTYNLLFFSNILVLSWYYLLFFETRFKRLVGFSGAIVNILLFVYINVFSTGFNEYNYFLYGISFITIVLYSLLYLQQLLASLKEESLLRTFDFWLICGYLLYFLGSFVIVLYYDGSTDSFIRGDMWVMHNIILLICSVVTLSLSIRISKKNNPHHV